MRGLRRRIRWVSDTMMRHFRRAHLCLPISQSVEQGVQSIFVRARHFLSHGQIVRALGLSYEDLGARSLAGDGSLSLQRSLRVAHKVVYQLSHGDLVHTWREQALLHEHHDAMERSQEFYRYARPQLFIKTRSQ